MTNHYPYILIGQGIAGTVLSLCLQQRGIKHLIVDKPSMSSSSKIAAGLVNPVVLKRLKAVKDAQGFMEVALPFYQHVVKQYSASFLHQTEIHHILHNQEEQNNWLAKSDNPSLSHFLNPQISFESVKNIKAPFGFGKVNNSFWVNTKRFIEAHKDFGNVDIQNSEITVSSIHLEKKKITSSGKTYSYDRLIDCTGHLTRNLNPVLKNAFSPTRGEVLIIKSTHLLESIILHAGVFILPLGNHHFKVGATYHWDSLADTPTEEGKRKLIEELEKVFTGEYTVIEHLAGVRPNTKDRKPLLGKIAEACYAFNGMGSRGVLMAPYLAALLIDSIEKNEELPSQYNVARFTSN